jgi:beta-1,4-mannosyltransferase
MSLSERLTSTVVEEQRRSQNGAANGAVRVAVFVRMHRNPYGALLYSALAEHGVQLAAEGRLQARWIWQHRKEVSVLHFHWDQCFSESVSLRPRFRGLRSWIKTAHFAWLLTLARMLGYKIIWTVHEVLPHEVRSRRRDLIAARILAKSSHALTAHDPATAVRATELLRPRNKRIAVMPHGSFDGVYPAGRGREAVREEWQLGDSNFVFLAFGNLRRYKRLELLLDAFASVTDPNARLVIAGEFLWRLPEPEWEAHMRARLEHAAARDPRIRFRVGRVPGEGVAELHAACDAAVLARSDGWTSGSLILALSEGLPVIAARRPAYVELIGDDAAGWLYEPGDVESLSETMAIVASDHEQARVKGRMARERAAELDWKTTATDTAAVMLSMLSNGRPHRANGHP